MSWLFKRRSRPTPVASDSGTGIENGNTTGMQGAARLPAYSQSPSIRYPELSLHKKHSLREHLSRSMNALSIVRHSPTSSPRSSHAIAISSRKSICEDGDGLVSAVITADEKLVRKVVATSSNVSINSVEEAMFVAVKYDQAGILKVLLTESSVDPCFGNSILLHVSCSAGNANVTRVLLEDKRCDPKSNESLALRNAAKSGSTETLALLLVDGRADPNARNNEALNELCRTYNFDGILLLASDPRVSLSGRATGILLDACSLNRPAIVEQLLYDPDVDPTVMDNRPLYVASYAGFVDVVHVLLEDTRVDPSNGIALVAACNSGHFDVVCRLLEDPRVDPTVRQNAALKIAARNGHVRLVDLLLAFIDPAKGNQAVIRECAKGGSADVMQLLLTDDRVDPTYSDSAPFRTACTFGHTSVVSVLVEDGRVNPSAMDNDAILSAAWFGRSDVVKLLLSLGPKVDPTVRNGYAVRWAVYRKHYKTALQLLKDQRVISSLFEPKPVEQHEQSHHGRHSSFLTHRPSDVELPGSWDPVLQLMEVSQQESIRTAVACLAMIQVKLPSDTLQPHKVSIPWELIYSLITTYCTFIH